MKKVTIALLLLVAMPLYGTRSKKAPKTSSWKQYRQELANTTMTNNPASIAQQACRREQQTLAQQTRQADVTHKKLVYSRIKEHSDSELKECCIALIASGCLYIYVKHGEQISNYFNTTKLS